MMHDGAYAKKCQQHLCVHVLMDEIVSKMAVLATEKGRDHGEAHKNVGSVELLEELYIFGFPQIYVLADIFLALTS